MPVRLAIADVVHMNPSFCSRVSVLYVRYAYALSLSGRRPGAVHRRSWGACARDVPCLKDVCTDWRGIARPSRVRARQFVRWLYCNK